MANHAPLDPTVALLAKIGSIAVHADEMIGPNGHQFDATALKALLADPEVVEWLDHMRRMALVPKKRT
jgi:hypothetical protein